MEGIRLLNVVIPARRFGDTLVFYRDVLGLPVLHEGRATRSNSSNWRNRESAALMAGRRFRAFT